MKKAKVIVAPSPPAPSDKPPATAIIPISKALTPPERNRTDSTSSNPTRKHSATDKPAQGKLTKHHNLSKSQDNLASQLRRKAVAAALHQKEASNKENVTFKTPTTPKTKSKSVSGTPGVKPHGNNIEGSGTPIKRAQSAQNITKATPAQPAGKAGSAVKKASSTQNLTKGGVRQMRISAPVNVMAYNAELLSSFEKEKKSLERRISELIQLAETRKTEIEIFKFEVKNLKEQMPNEDVQEQLEMLHDENILLKDRLRELGVPVEHITDSEKLLLKKNSESESTEGKGATGGGDGYSKGVAESALSGISGEAVDLRSADSELGLSVGDLSCITPDHPSSLALSYDNSNWDKLSNKSSDAMSEVSVACLQDRISQMEETHYSTSEELQATLQELTDLQDAVNDLSSENERLADERSVLLESLCAQTEKLENCRMQIEHLKALLISESEAGDRSENERQLVALIKSAQEEREEFLLKQIELNNALQAYENEHRELQDIITALRDKTHILEMKNESLLADKRALEAQVAELKETTAKDQIETTRYKTLYENEKAKVAELEQYRNATDKTDLEELLDNTRQEKDKVEEKLTNTQEELAVMRNEMSKLQEQVSILNEELKVTKNNAKTQVSDLDYKMEKMANDKVQMTDEINTLRDHIDQLQLDCDRYLDEKKTHNASISDLEYELKTTKARLQEMEMNLRESKSRFREEQEEWRQFQADLQTAVVIANDMKTETSEEMDRILSDNLSQKEKNDVLARELDTLREEIDQLKQMKEMTRNDIRGRVFSTVDREFQQIRGRKASDPHGNQNLSVKNLIASIEHQVKTPPMSPALASQCSSRRNSTDSSISLTSNKSDSPTKTDLSRRSSMPADSHLKSALRKPAEVKEARVTLSHRQPLTNIIYDKAPPSSLIDDTKTSPTSSRPGEAEANKNNRTPRSALKKPPPSEDKADKTSSIIHGMQHGTKTDPLAHLAKLMGGSKRNALLKWCQSKTANYPGIDITNFSSSWNDGLAFCAIMHSYLPDKVPYRELNSQDKRRNFTLAFKAAESVNIPSNLEINNMVAIERPDWQAVMGYVTSIYKHFEVDNKS